MKKKTLLNVIIITLLIIMSVSFIVAAFMHGKDSGFAAVALMSFVYILILIEDKND